MIIPSTNEDFGSVSAPAIENNRLEGKKKARRS